MYLDDCDHSRRADLVPCLSQPEFTDPRRPTDPHVVLERADLGSLLLRPAFLHETYSTDYGHRELHVSLHLRSDERRDLPPVGSGLPGTFKPEPGIVDDRAELGHQARMHIRHLFLDPHGPQYVLVSV